ncbi:MAG: tripartite tricarboxylate transporter TctB family protein [bacterium]|nr:tripartite tricarboxylate transporter TctB family protein [bacterium]
MRKAEIITSCLLIAMGLVFLFYLIPEQTAEGDGMGMAPKTLPNITMGAITVLSTILLLFNLFVKKEQEEDVPPVLTENIVNIVKFSGILVAGTAIINFFGFIPGSIAIIGSFYFLTGGRSPIKIALVAVIPSLLVYFLLRYAFNAPLP